MNFSETAHKNGDKEILVRSLQQWWKEAGVDLDYQEAPQGLLEKTKPAVPTNVHFSESPPADPAQPTKNSVAEVPEEDTIPDTLETFLQWMKSAPAVSGQHATNDTVFPYGPANPELMVIVGMPDQVRSDPRKIFDQPAEKLVQNMLRAVNVASDSVFFTPLSLFRPIEGRIDHSLYPALNRRMLQLIELVAPKKIIMFGDAATRALCDAELLSARKKKHFINQGSSQTEAIATFHPRILIDRPEIKAEAWQDLQLLLGTD